MSGHLQKFLVTATQKASADLITAVGNLPEGKSSWSPFDKGRSAVDQVAECAILNGLSADLIAKRAFPADFTMEAFVSAKAELAAGDWESLKSLLAANTALVVASIEAVPDEDLELIIAMPWGERTLAEIMSYCYWNMSYHEGQTNYIASLIA